MSSDRILANNELNIKESSSSISNVVNDLKAEMSNAINELQLLQRKRFIKQRG